MPNPHMSTQDWFYHAPAAKSTGPTCIVAPVASQIPGLSITPNDPLETGQDDRHFRRKWIRDTDSKYVRLAKAGGRKHLLAFNNDPKQSSEPVLYPRVDWFDHVHIEEVEPQGSEKNLTKNFAVLPEWYVHEQPLVDNNVAKSHEIHAADEPVKRPMLGFDSMSVWQRDDQEPVVKTSVQFPKIRKKKLYSSSKTKFTKMPVKLPKLKTDINNSDHSQEMKKLLSMDYQKEWLLNKTLEDSKEMQAKKAIQKEKHEREKQIVNRHQQSLKPKNETGEERPLFKLSRFSKVKSCVDTRWSRLESEKKSETEQR